MYRYLAALALTASLTGSAIAEPLPKDASSKRSQTVSKAIQFLKSSQASDGSWSAAKGPAITALCVTSLRENGVPASDAAVQRGVEYLEQFVQPSGGVHHPQSLYRNYETSLAVLCFSKVNEDGEYDEKIAKADKFLKGVQWTNESVDRGDPAFGGGGYGKHKRPDLSNTSFLIEALKAAGNDADSKAVQDALLFVSRCQNLETEHNTTPFASKNPDGGFYYTPAAGGSSQAGETDNGGLRSYGSMTYQGLKSMIYAGVGPDDPRVKAAFQWIQDHYNLKSNPGMGDAGLFYYYHTFAKALNAMDVTTVETADGEKRDWRVDLIDELARRQRPDGSFANDNERWLESDPNLVTAYSLMGLAYCK